AISIVAVIATWLYLPETNKHIGQVHEGKLFDFTRMWHALKDPAVGITFVLTFLFSLALFMFFLGFQPYMVKALHLSTFEISALFTIFGVAGLISQTFLGQITKRIGLKRTFNVVFAVIALTFVAMYFTKLLIPFVIMNVILGFLNPTINPMLQTILSQETDPKMQGVMQGLNTSYMNLGQILGPILGGYLATISLTMPFLAAALMTFVCFVLSFQVLKHKLDHPIT
ncbi:MFS transporter, partial [Candidatus Microgenomates bacterium]|nr:MFS transporter [Candidatus Microgenomates bacterium]